MAAPESTVDKRVRRKKPALPPDVATVDYKDLTLLRMFISDRGKIRSRRITGPRHRQVLLVATKGSHALPNPGRPSH